MKPKEKTKPELFRNSGNFRILQLTTPCFEGEFFGVNMKRKKTERMNGKYGSKSKKYSLKKTLNKHKIVLKIRNGPESIRVC